MIDRIDPAAAKVEAAGVVRNGVVIGGLDDWEDQIQYDVPRREVPEYRRLADALRAYAGELEHVLAEEGEIDPTAIVSVGEPKGVEGRADAAFGVAIENLYGYGSPRVETSIQEAFPVSDGVQADPSGFSGKMRGLFEKAGVPVGKVLAAVQVDRAIDAVGARNGLLDPSKMTRGIVWGEIRKALALQQ